MHPYGPLDGIGHVTSTQENEMTDTTEKTLVTRRSIFGAMGGATLSAGAVALLATTTGLGRVHGAHAANAEQDVIILNTAISAEHEAVAAYAAVAGADILSKLALDLGVTFMGHHQEHAEALANAIRSMGGTPTEPQSSYDFPLGDLTDEAAALGFAADLERGAVSAYLGAVPLFEDRALAGAAASILGDEAMHWAALRFALGQAPVPMAFVT
jgi:hypothetical protein